MLGLVFSLSGNLFKLVDLGTVIRIKENTSGQAKDANQSLMTFTQMKFAG
jgi:hypothetical protein